MDVSERTIAYESYRSEDNNCRFLAVDAAQAVPDRGAFARAAVEREDDVAGVLFLALEEGYAEPRVVTTLLTPDGAVERVTHAAASCAAAWAVDRIRDDTVLLDTQTGTFRAAVSGETVRIESLAPGAEDATAAVRRDRERDASLAAPAPAPVPDGGRPNRSGTDVVTSEEVRPADDD
jgi:diaminopimelate epimerase